jgi:hypothetical protein
MFFAYPEPVAWATSTKFRWQAKAMARQLVKQEKFWREQVARSVRIYTPEEIIAFASQRGWGVATTVTAAITTEKKTQNDK